MCVCLDVCALQESTVCVLVCSLISLCVCWNGHLFHCVCACVCELKLVLVHCASLGFSSTVRVCVTVKYVLELP